MSIRTFRFSPVKGSNSVNLQLYLSLIAFLICSVVLAENMCGLRPPSEETDTCAAGTCGLRPPPSDEASPSSDDDVHPADLNKDGTVTSEEFVQFAAEEEKPAEAGSETVSYSNCATTILSSADNLQLAIPLLKRFDDRRSAILSSN